MFIIRFIGRIILALVLAVVTNWISWFVIYRGEGVMFLFFLALLNIWPLVKMFMAKNKAAGEKLHRSFSDTVCSVLGMISAWARSHTQQPQSAVTAAEATPEPAADELPKEEFSD